MYYLASTCRQSRHRRCNSRQQIKGHNGKRAASKAAPIRQAGKASERKAYRASCLQSIPVFCYSFLNARRRNISTAPARNNALPAAATDHRPAPVLASCLCGLGVGGTAGGVAGGTVGGTTGGAGGFGGVGGTTGGIFLSTIFTSAVFAPFLRLPAVIFTGAAFSYPSGAVTSVRV